MPMMPVNITMTSTGVSRTVITDYLSGKPLVVGTTFGSTTMTATYTTEYTMTDPNLLSILGSTQATVWTADETLLSSAPGTSGYLYPVAAFRFTVSAISSSYVNFFVIQG